MGGAVLGDTTSPAFRLAVVESPIRFDVFEVKATGSIKVRFAGSQLQKTQ
jgi:hypothetical protein